MLRRFGLLSLFVSLIPIVIGFAASLYGWPFEVVGNEWLIAFGSFGASLAFVILGGGLLHIYAQTHTPIYALFLRMFLLVFLYAWLFFLFLPLSFLMRNAILPKQCMENAIVQIIGRGTTHSRVNHQMPVRVAEYIKQLKLNELYDKYLITRNIPVLVEQTVGSGLVQVSIGLRDLTPEQKSFIIQLHPGESCTIYDLASYRATE